MNELFVTISISAMVLLVILINNINDCLNEIAKKLTSINETLSLFLEEKQYSNSDKYIYKMVDGNWCKYDKYTNIWVAMANPPKKDEIKHD